MRLHAWIMLKNFLRCLVKLLLAHKQRPFDRNAVRTKCLLKWNGAVFSVPSVVCIYFFGARKISRALCVFFFMERKSKKYLKQFLVAKIISSTMSQQYEYNNKPLNIIVMLLLFFFLFQPVANTIVRSFQLKTFINWIFAKLNDSKPTAHTLHQIEQTFFSLQCDCLESFFFFLSCQCVW